MVVESWVTEEAARIVKHQGSDLISRRDRLGLQRGSDKWWLL